MYESPIVFTPITVNTKRDQKTRDQVLLRRSTGGSQRDLHGSFKPEVLKRIFHKVTNFLYMFYRSINVGDHTD